MKYLSAVHEHAGRSKYKYKSKILIKDQMDSPVLVCIEYHIYRRKRLSLADVFITRTVQQYHLIIKFLRAFVNIIASIT